MAFSAISGHSLKFAKSLHPAGFRAISVCRRSHTFARRARRVCSPAVAQNPETSADGRQQTAHRPLSEALPPAPRGQRVEVFDSRVPGFGIRICDIKDADPARRGKAGKISFVLYARFSPGAAPTRRVIGIYGAITLEEARRIAGEWRSQIAKGIDPAVVEAEAREKAARERALRIRHSFATAAEDIHRGQAGTGAQRQGGRARLPHHLRRRMGRPTDQRDHQVRRAGDHQRQEAPRTADGPRICWS